LNHSLSYILPVKNAQSDLVQQVERLLDMLSELTPWFELLIVDEQSYDDTQEIAYDLAQRYPQVNVTRCTEDQLENLLDTMSKLHSEVVFLADRQSRPEAYELRQLWDMRHNDRLVMARLPRGPENLPDDLITRLISWGDALRDAGSGSSTHSVRMLRRSAMMRMNQRRETPQLAY
jgi:glycosyltransferase involved in cell wall biosynthesis